MSQGSGTGDLGAVGYLLKNADEERCRRINTGNAAFQARVGAAGAGGVEVLETVGFQVGGLLCWADCCAVRLRFGV